MSTPFFVLAGPCVIEDEGLTREIAAELKSQLSGLPIEFYFKASFDKANRSSIDSFRGPGLSQGLKILEKIKSDYHLSLLTDVHGIEQVEPAAAAVDMLQIPAFLCRQTDLLLAAQAACLKHHRRMNVKKGQFLAPWDVKNIIKKIDQVPLSITERGVSFGYNALIVDMSSFQIIQNLGSGRNPPIPAIYDATHSIQVPGGAEGGKTTGGKREILEVLARAAMAAGADGVFLECHPNPKIAKSDGPNAFYLDKVGAFVKQLLEIKKVTSQMPKLLPEAHAH